MVRHNSVAKIYKNIETNKILDKKIKKFLISGTSY